MFRKKSLTAAVLAAGLTLSACTGNTASPAKTTTAEQVQENSDYDTTNPPTVAQAISTNNGAESYTSWSDSEAVQIDDPAIKITSGGVYKISGSHESITVDAGEEQVALLLDNATIADAITINSASDVAISTNGTNEARNIGAESNLTLMGTGALTISAPEDGITAKKSLIVESGTFTITAGDDGLQGNDSLIINNGDITIKAGGDGLKSDSEDEKNGYVLLTGGTVKATTTGDGISAASDVLITGGTTDITSGGGSEQAKTDTSAKGIKADDYILTSGGTTTINSADDALHSNGALRLSDGTMTIATNDDGIHAEVAAILDGSDITISTSKEAIEGGLITISAGDITATSTDDAINGSGSTTVEAGIQAAESETTTEESKPAPGGLPPVMNGAPGGGAPGGAPKEENTGEQVTITGGNITLNAGGDGLDSNGDLTITGGTTRVNGPATGGNGAIDYSGTFSITGGELLTIGANGMASAPSTQDGQGWIQTTATGTKGDTIIIKNSSQETIAEFNATNDFGIVQYSSPKITKGENYTISVNDEEYTVAEGEIESSSMPQPPQGMPMNS